MALENHWSPLQGGIWCRYRLFGRIAGHWEEVPTDLAALATGCWGWDRAAAHAAVLPVMVGPSNFEERSWDCSSEEDSSGVVGCCGGFRRFWRAC